MTYYHSISSYDVWNLQIYLAKFLGLIIAPGRCVSGHVVRASFSQIRHRNALTEKAWENAV